VLELHFAELNRNDKYAKAGPAYLVITPNCRDYRRAETGGDADAYPADHAANLN
jgi:hypothetical protein